MRACSIILFCLLFTKGYSQVNFNELVSDNLSYQQLRGFLKPEFKWDMNGKAQAFLNEAINLIDEGTPRQALPELDEAIKLEPGLWVIHYYKGVSLKLIGEDQAAEQSFRTANGIERRNYYVAMELGKTLDLQMQYDKAERMYEVASEIDPTSALPHYLIASVLAKTNGLTRAKKKFAYCAELDPSFLHGEVMLAIIEGSENSDSKSAAGRLESVLQKDSTNRTALIFHAALVYEQNKAASLKDIDRLVALDPTNIRLRFLRGILSTETGDFERAFSDLRKVVDALPAEDFEARGRQTAEDKRLDLKYAGFYVVSNVYGLPEREGAKIKKAYCLLFTGGFDEATRSITSVRGVWKNPLCLYLLGVVHEHRGIHQAAFVNYDNALNLDPDIYDAHKKRGIYYTELKRWPEALNDFNEMLRINPASVSAYRFRGLVNSHTNNLNAAVVDFNTYLAKDSTSLEVHGFRGTVYYKLGQTLPSTLDLLQSDQRKDVAPKDTIFSKLKGLVRTDLSKALWYTDRFIYYGYNSAYRMKTSLLMEADRWAQVEALADSLGPQLLQLNSVKFLLDPTDKAYVATAKGICRAKQGAHKDALKIFDLAIKTDPGCGLAYLERGKVYRALGNSKAAMKDLKKASTLGLKEADQLLKKEFEGG